MTVDDELDAAAHHGEIDRADHLSGVGGHDLHVGL